MEARNFVTAREMVQQGNWLLPTMNDLPRVTKPPLPTWLSAVMMKVSGNVDSLAVLRFPAGLAASCMVFFMFGFSRKFAKNTLSPFLNALVLASCFYVIFLGRQGTWDIFCHSFMLLGIWWLHKGWHGTKQNYGWFLGAGLAMGLSFLSKGPVSFYTVLLPFLIASFICFDSGDARRRWKGMLLTFVTTLIVGGAWPLYVFLNMPDVATAVAQTESGSWINRNVRPFWYYWNFPAHSGIWLVMGVVVLVWPYARPRINQLTNYNFFLFWLLAAILLLSVVPEKKVRYLLPAFIPFSFLVGNYLSYLIDVYKKKSETAWDRRILLTNTIIFLAIAFSVPIACYFQFYRHGLMSTTYFVFCLLLYWTLAWGIGYYHKTKSILLLVLTIVALNATVYFLLYPLASPLIYKNPNHQSLTSVRNLPDMKGADLYYLNDQNEIRMERVWEIGRPVKQWPVTDKCQPPQATPFILFTKQPPEQLFEACPTQLRYELIATFDYRREKSGDIYYVSRLIPDSNKNINEN
ncbi:glycosyltransferase family 39 protein [Fulvivirgaceae bacterium BMA12]|uniref:Glycosyltransferase family 39 protein n=1 Tax=Agaribacillus aureus TaxID=3051825 RepID=A0ABT8LLL4_9BACT|nr:glycosyltransferase family 39 protein [Fulvivirgaceae bacterium BMA12]